MQILRHPLETKKNRDQRIIIMMKKTLGLCVAWLVFLACLFMVEYRDSDATHRELLLSTARALFERVVLARRWNAMHGGVYVPVTKETQPNPYLEDPLRNIKVNDSLTLTKVNPAYMTRQMAEMSAGTGGVRIHITSLRPIRPENRATPREEKALESFEKGLTEVGETIKDGQDSKFFYMAPLKVEKGCLKCHAKQGYKEGDLRGGISIIFPFPHKDHLLSLAISHMVIGLFGLSGIILFGVRLDNSYKIIQQQAVIDALTGIPNRRAFMERTAVEFKRSMRYGKPLSIVMADIDFFKSYNDAYGHAAGDACLQKVAQAIKATLKRPGDFCARYGGEEFVLFLPDTPREAALLVAERIRAAVESMAIPHENAHPFGIVTLSLGVSTVGGASTDSFEKELQLADKALYAAKERGRNRVEVNDQNC